MSLEDIVRKYYVDAFKRDIDAVMAICDENVVFDWKANDDAGGKLRSLIVGKKDFRERFESMERVFEYRKIELLDTIAVGNRVATQIRLTMRRKSDGVEFRLPVADFWTFRGGKAIELVEYYDTALGEAMMTTAAKT